MVQSIAAIGNALRSSTDENVEVVESLVLSKHNMNGNVKLNMPIMSLVDDE